ncbi:MAG TPA: hypothetical protein VET66_12355 [Steroidobacteraceae bacterium]|nr:hypothetical protein [Dehalococcoidia bacterium]HYM28934.1 hypothetical protein [Steroidobacteraceae bacterium]
MVQADEAWQRYARAVIASMSEALGDAHEASHGMMLETADYWLSLGLAAGLARPADAERLLALILSQEQGDRAEIDRDAAEFCQEALA